MNKRTSIRTKILLSVLLSTGSILFIIILYFVLNTRNITLENAKKLTDTYAKEYANYVKSELNIDMGIARTLAHSFKGYKKINPQARTKIYNEILKNVLNENLAYISIWSSWEISAIDNNYSKSYGRIRTTFFRENDKIEINIDTIDLDGDNVQGLYYNAKVDKREICTNPYFDSYTKDSKNTILESSSYVPILNNGIFVGLVGMDIELTRFQSLINKIKPYKNSHAFLIANNGVFVTNPNKELINTPVENLFENSELETNIDIKKNIKNGEAFAFNCKDETNYSYFSFAPIEIGQTGKPWSLCIVVPNQVIMDKINTRMWISIAIGFLSMIIMFGIIILISHKITIPLRAIANLLKKLNKNNVEELNQITLTHNNEVGEIAKSANILINWINTTGEFADEIAKGNLEVQYSILNENDRLGKSLLTLRTNLLKNKTEENARKIEDKTRNWLVAGTVKFNELLQHNYKDLEILANNIVTNFVEYLDVNQCGLFIVNEENEHNIHFDLVACYAYDRLKIVNKQIELGEGLVGVCAAEKKSIYMTKLPDNYMSISSGLGDATPKSLLIVPLKVKNDVYGIIEIASFQELKKYQIEFVENISENIATSISSSKINARTARLLEISNNHSEKLLEKEQQMEETIRELEEVRKEMAIKSEQQENEIKNLKNTIQDLTS